MATIASSLSRVRNSLKAVKEDPFLTDRFLYSLVMKFGKTLMYREAKKSNVYRNSALFKEIPCVELQEVSSIEACCTSIKTKCTFMKSKYPLPSMVQLVAGPVIRSVTSLDYSQELYKTEPSLYANMARDPNFKYNPAKYYWLLDNYIVIPDIDWEAVRVSAMFEESVSHLQCGETGSVADCPLEQEREISIPEYLFSEIETAIRQELFGTIQIPPEGPDDQQSLMR